MPAVLWFDAATCLLMGAALLSLSAPLAVLLGLPPALLRWAGLLLLPCAMLMALAARQRPPASALVGLIVAGNLAWAVASGVVVAVADGLTAFGTAFVLLQAAAVLVLAALEWRGLR
ncbi:MAG: hypothetical protein KF683_18720 [Rubrivivax sp.]|nr:hypothetical protein [Rubrivivax sp.]